MSLLSVQGDNTDKLFGVLADTSILGVIVKNPGLRRLRGGDPVAKHDGEMPTIDAEFQALLFRSFR